MSENLNDAPQNVVSPVIRKVAVIGSGVMGGGIAAQVANAGVPVLLFDVTREVAAAALDRLSRAEPSPFMEEANAGLVSPLGTDRDLAQLAHCDWIVEAVVERLDVKRALYAAVARHASPDAMVSSNTSTMRLAELVDGTTDTLRRRFIITHFFNPPRHMRLVEIVRGSADQAPADRVADFVDRQLGKSVVWCKDRPGFIANRLGCFWSQAAMATAYDMNLTVEEADAVMGKSFGIPKTGVFALMDLVGIDLIPDVNASLAQALEPDDLFQRVNVPLPFMERMIAAGLTGRKGKGGFFRINRERGKVREAIDLRSLDYRKAVEIAIDRTVPLLEQDSKLGRYARRVWALVFAYAGNLLGDAADDVASIDAAMCLGYNWQWGPFALMDRIGLPKIRELIDAEGLAVPSSLGADCFYAGGRALTAAHTYTEVARPQGVVFLADRKRHGAPVMANECAALWDLGEGVAAFEIASKMNVIDGGVLDLLDRTIAAVDSGFNALVIAGDGPHTSAGFNLKQAMAYIDAGDWRGIEALIARGQTVFKALKYAPFPSVGAGYGLALGGGCELLLHCSAIEAHAEASIGLVECSVGLIPGWGGNGELLLRLGLAGDPVQAITGAFRAIAGAKVARPAANARRMGFLRGNDGITMNRDRLIAAAKAKALALVPGYRPPERPLFTFAWPEAAEHLMQEAQAMRQPGTATDHDLVVAEALAATLTGGGGGRSHALSEAALLDVERAQFMALIGNKKTWDRIRHMLDTGLPLRN